MDWAPDCAIHLVIDELVARRIRATWFVTHVSPAVERLRRYPKLFELGIHPNFLLGSTHGDTPEAVSRHCMALVPDAISMRTHGLAQSTVLLERVLAATPIAVDVSLFLPRAPALQPVEYPWRGRILTRIPYFWEDDFEMERTTPCWRVAPLLTVGEGLKVFDFHPIHIYLNSAEPGPYEALKQRVSKLSEAVPDEIAPYVRHGEGTRTLFLELIECLTLIGQSACIRDIHQRWRLQESGVVELQSTR